MRSIHAVLSALCLMLLVSHGALADGRVALVIGNSSYKNIPALANPKHDAALMENTLRQVGFEVVTAIDADRRTMGRAIRNFGKTLRGAGKDAVGLIYFAGHGIQARGGNYLIPIGATIEDLADLEIESAECIGHSGSAGIGGKPPQSGHPRCLPQQPAQGRARGRAPAGSRACKAASGTLVAFAAAPGQVAADGARRQLALYRPPWSRPSGSRACASSRCSSRCGSASRRDRRQQTPWEESSLRGEFYFTPAVQTTATQSPAAQTKQPSHSNSVELVFWSTIKDSQDPALFNDYLKQYPNGLFAGLARTMIGRLEATIAQRKAQEDAQENDRRIETARLQAARDASDKTTRRAADVSFWNTVKDSHDKALIQSYLDRFPDGVFSTLAQLMIARLDTVKQVASRTVPSTNPARADAERPGSEQQIAAIAPSTMTEPVQDSDPDLPRMIQSALADAGCDPGGVDGQWGRNSQTALNRFARYANLTLPDEPVSAATLRLLRRHDGRVCPLSCNARQVEKNGRCIAKTCPKGERLSNKGSCYRPSAATTAKNKPAKRKKRKKTPNAGGHHLCSKIAALDPSVCD